MCLLSSIFYQIPNYLIEVLSLIHDAKVRRFWITQTFFIQNHQKSALFLIQINCLCASTSKLWSHTAPFLRYWSVLQIQE